MGRITEIADRRILPPVSLAGDLFSLGESHATTQRCDAASHAVARPHSLQLRAIFPGATPELYTHVATCRAALQACTSVGMKGS